MPTFTITITVIVTTEEDDKTNAKVTADEITEQISDMLWQWPLGIQTKIEEE